MIKINTLSIILTTLLWIGHAQAGVVVGGTRFIYPSDAPFLTVTLTNTSQQPWLINARIGSPQIWPGAEPATAKAPLLAAPPLFLLKEEMTGTLRLVATPNNLPNDRETLFALSIASVPPGHPQSNSVKVAMRSSFKLFWRPVELKGDPLTAYQKLRWTLTPQGVLATNPTPYYINLSQVVVNGVGVTNVGVVAPKGQRQTGWCEKRAHCELRWRAINDYGGISPQMLQAFP